MVIAIMLLAGFVAFLPSSDAKAVDDKPAAIVDPIAKTVSQDYMDSITVDSSSSDVATVATAAATSADAIGTVKNFIATDSYAGSANPIYLEQIEKRGEGQYCEVWVGTDLNYGGVTSRNANVSQLTITDAQVAMIIKEWDNNIYKNMSDFFGVPGARNGSEARVATVEGLGSDYFNTTTGEKTMIVIYNIRDDNYWTVSKYYTAGYFWSSVDNVYDRNIINIDCFDWNNRTGVQSNVAKSYLYESVVAHEYQHLIHNWYDPNEESFVNEGCSMYAQLVCGYGVTSMMGDIGNFLAEPSNSLTVWGDGDDLADYGAAALFTVYLNDKFGGAATIQALVKNNMTGTEGITDTLQDRGYTKWNFDLVFKNWRIANLIDSNQPGNGKYKYDTLNLADIGAMYESSYMIYSGQYDRYEDGPGYLYEYATDYIHIARGSMRTRDRVSTMLQFYGDVQDSSGWKSYYEDGYGYYWWSNAGNDMDTSLVGTIDLTDTAATHHTLGIYTAYSIEPTWDYGFVQVSTDGGKNWTSLANAYTSSSPDPDAASNIVAEMPGLTGSSGGMIYMTFDISAYDEQEIMVQFRYMTDSAAVYGGWEIDYVTLDGVEIDDAEMQQVFEPTSAQENWYVTAVLYHRDAVIGIVDIPLQQYFEGYYGEFKLFKLRAVTDITLLVSPTVGIGDYAIEVRSTHYI